MVKDVRCGLCEACLTVEATKRIVFVECRPCGPGCTDATVKMWNAVLKDNPCSGDPSTGDEIRRREAIGRVIREREYRRECVRQDREARKAR